MVARVRKIGQWNAATRLVKNLAKELRNARQTSLKRWAVQAEKTAKGHIVNQDLGWAALASTTIAVKTRKGFSLDTLIASSTYFKAITHWVEKDSGIDTKCYVGVKQGVKYTRKGTTKGMEVGKAAAIQELGSISDNIPKRPLWEPTGKEVMQWHLKNNQPGSIFLEIIRKKYTI